MAAMPTCSAGKRLSTRQRKWAVHRAAITPEARDAAQRRHRRERTSVRKPARIHAIRTCAVACAQAYRPIWDRPSLSTVHLNALSAGMWCPDVHPRFPGRAWDQHTRVGWSFRPGCGILTMEVAETTLATEELEWNPSMLRFRDGGTPVILRFNHEELAL
ncbi:hypothetical protein EXIGLDRAFT_284803 [Exidia glandulosa HHB12029]|uniref:Uncharacterized protein n=1 Tax=Exidia glandulosa HHB12029 TaxID=1314781 RepID=A0A165M3M1_EXIGL|nr:hypothetical protein EXIGLDRAFT_284803 [Exidia glandulosa HHB12029]